MPIVLSYRTNVNPDEYDDVVTRIRYHDELPEGLIMHTAAVTGEGDMLVVDIWETREHHDRFLAIRGCPALRDVTGEQRRADATEVLVRPVNQPT